MKRYLSDALLFISGAAVGSLITWVSVKKYYELKADLEVESVREAYDERMREIEPVKDTLHGDIEGPEEIADGAYKTTNSIVRQLNNKPPLKDYTKYFKEAKKEDVDKAELETPPEDEPYTEEEDKLQTLAAVDAQLNDAHRKAIKEGKEPYIIDKEEYELTNDHYDKATLIYYVYDEILATDDNEILDDEAFYVGSSLVESGFTDSEEDTLYVRNDKLTTDYEVTKVYTPFNGE